MELSNKTYGPLIKVKLLGRFSITSQVGELTLPTSKVRSLAAYLFWKQGEWIQRDILRSMFWGDMGGEKASANLRQAFYSLRKALSAHCDTNTVLRIKRDKVQIALQQNIYIDTSPFEQKAKMGLQADSLDISPLMAAAALYTGDFLENIDEDWCLIERVRLADMHIAVLRELVGRLIGLGLYQSAIPHAHRWIEANQLDEFAHQALIRLYSALGQPAKAQEQFHICHRMLKEELGVPPSESTMRLCKELGLQAGERSTRYRAPKNPAGQGNTAVATHPPLKDISRDPLRSAELLLIYGEDKVLQGCITEGLEALDKALSTYIKFDRKQEQARARLLIGGALLEAPLINCKQEKTLLYVEPALEYYRIQGFSTELCNALLFTARAYCESERFEEAIALAHEGTEIASSLCDKILLSKFSWVLGIALRDTQRLKEAQIALEGAAMGLSISINTQDVLGITCERALLYLLTGDLVIAERLLREALSVAQVITDSPKLDRFKTIVAGNLSYLLYLQGQLEEARAICPPPEASKYNPNHMPATALFLSPDADIKEIVPPYERWLRGNLSSLPDNYVHPLTLVITWWTIEACMLREAAGWTAFGIRHARARGWNRWMGKHYANRAVVMAKLGSIEKAKVCIRRSEILADEGNRWTPALLAWAAGLIAQAEGDKKAAKRHLKRSYSLFKQMGNNHHKTLVEADMA